MYTNLGLASIVVPAYNVQKYIERCVCSLIQQTYDNIEIIIIDDGSTDNTYSICKRLSAEDDRVILMHQENAGLSAARNTALNCCKGEYILFCDSDDYTEPEWVKALINAIEKSHAEMAICNFESGDVINNASKVDNYTSTFSLLDLFECNLLSTVWNKIYLHSVIKNNNIHFDSEASHIAEDLLFNIEYLSCIKTKPAYTDKVLYNYTINYNSVSRNYVPNMWEEKKEVYRKFKQLLKDVEGDVDECRFSKHFLFMVERCMRNLRFNGYNSGRFERIKQYQIMLDDPDTCQAINIVNLKSFPLSYRTLFKRRKGVLFELFFDLYDLKKSIQSQLKF